MSRFALGFVAALVLLFTCVAQAQLGEGTPKIDKRVGDLLDGLEINHTIDEDGDYQVIFEMEEGRTQAAIIRSITYEYRNFEVREIWSAGYKAEKELIPAEVANRLLEDSFLKKLGAWTKSGQHALFVVKIAAKSDAESLLSALQLTLESADEMERELTGETDEF